MVISCCSRLSVSPNGWITTDILMSWLEEVFIPGKEAIVNGRQCFLFLDNQATHVQFEFIKKCKENNIAVIGFPPHCTHALQPLDVTCFAPLKTAYLENISQYCRTHLTKHPSKEKFLGVFGEAYNKAMTPSIIQHGFRATGIYPPKRGAIPPEKMAPSKATSLNATLPVAFTPRTKGVVNYYQNHLHEKSGKEATHGSPPTTPTPQRRTRSTSLESDRPLSVHRLMLRAVDETPEASYLLDASPDTLPAPPAPVIEQLPLIEAPKATPSGLRSMTKDELVRTCLDLTSTVLDADEALTNVRKIAIRAQAQLRLAAMHNVQLNRALNQGKAEKKNRGPVINGQACVFTKDRAIKEVEERAKAAEEEARKKREKKTEQATKKAWKQRVDREYRERVEAWKLEKADFTKMKEEMKAKGHPTRSLKPPAKPTKAGVETEMEEAARNDDGGEVFDLDGVGDGDDSD